MVKKFLFGIVIALGVVCYMDNHAFAQQMTVIADGSARVGENETEIQAKHRALLAAQQKALEEAGVIVASKTTIVNHRVLEDWIQSVAVARIQSKVVAESRSIKDNAVFFQVTLECKVNTDDIAVLKRELGVVLTPGGKNEKLTKKAETVKDFVLADGALYTGSMIDGLPDGRGVKKFPDGGEYQGEFRKGFREGAGTMVWANGTSYTGSWLRDSRCGEGELINEKGERQSGRWVNDVFYGD